VNLFDNVRVDYYGTPTPINQVANLHVPEPGMITVQPWDTSQIAPIEKAIRADDLGVNPSNDGKLIWIPIPPLNEERRKDPQYSPRRQRAHQEAREGKEDRRRRRPPRT
jgi:ribosome recycling factor